jgi:hypothetical protein
VRRLKIGRVSGGELALLVSKSDQSSKACLSDLYYVGLYSRCMLPMEKCKYFLRS